MPRLNNPRQEAVAQLKAKAYLDPANAPSDTAIVEKVYGYSRDSAEKNACVIMGSQGVKNRLNELITDEAIAKKGRKLFNWCDPFMDKAGNVLAKIPNGELQFKVWTQLLKLKGVIREGGINIDNRTMHVNLDSHLVNRLSNAVNSIQQMQLFTDSSKDVPQ